MRFGAFWQVPGYQGSSTPRRHWETIEEIILAEELGFDTAWLAESPFFPARPMSNPLMVAIAAAQHTERIRFGTLAAQAPLHHPFHMATQSATCDILTDGRLDLCLGGRWGSPAGRSFGHGDDISGAESRERVKEAIELIKLAWTEERVSFSGDYWRAEDLPVLPKPVQRPHPPLLLAANSDDTFPYAAKLGLGVIGTTLSQPMPRLIDRLREYRDARQPSENPSNQKAYVNISFFVAGTRDKAHEMMSLNWRNDDVRTAVADNAGTTVDATSPVFTSGTRGLIWASWDFEEAARNCIYDEPSACVERLAELQEKLPTMDECILEFNRRGRITSSNVKASMRLFAEKVMPKLT